jgi:single-strand DNA-binding protein
MASRSLNRVTLIGNLTRDPELKYTPAGTAVCTFGVATNRSWTTAEGQTKEEAQYHRIVAWHKLAELCGKLLVKGRKVYLEGRLTYRTFTGRDGQERTIAEIVLDDFIVFSDGRRMTETTTPIAKVEEKKEEVKTEIKTNVVKEKTEEIEETKDEDVNPDDIPF